MGIDELIPAQDISAEAAVLSVVFITPEKFDDVAPILVPEDFYSEAHRLIYKACKELRSQNKTPDLVTVASWLKDRDKMAAVGGMSYLTHVLDAAPVIANVEEYARIVKDKATLRRLAEATREISNACYLPVEDVAGFVASAEKRVQDIAKEGAKAQTAEGTGQILTRVVRGLMSGRRAGLETGITRWDRVTGGLHDGEVTVVGALTGRGKTSLALHVAYNVADELNCVAYFSLEMTKEVLVTRATCAEARVDVMAALNGTLTTDQFTKFCNAGHRIGFKRVYIDDEPGITINDIASRCIALQANLARKGRKLRLVVVDHIGLVAPTKDALKKGSREREVAEVSGGLQRLAKRLEIPILALSQLNREGDKRGIKDTRPRLSDIRESGAIANDARQVVFIHRDENAGRAGGATGMNAGTVSLASGGSTAELVIAKQNNGPIGVVNVGWEGHCTRFYNLAEVQ